MRCSDEWLEVRTRSAFAAPSARSSGRRFTASVLSLRNRQRLYNFFADDTMTDDTVVATVRTPSGRPVAARLDLADEFCRTWYCWGYERYEPGVARLLTIARTRAAGYRRSRARTSATTRC